jgi:hypothetical protein
VISRDGKSRKKSKKDLEGKDVSFDPMPQKFGSDVGLTICSGLEAIINL